MPLIMIFLGLPVHHAMGTALGAVMLSACLGVVSQRKYLRIVPALILGVSGMLTAPMGRFFGGKIDDFLLLILFFLMSVFIAVGMWLHASKGSTVSSSAGAVNVPSLREFFVSSSAVNLEGSSVASVFNAMQGVFRESWAILLTLCLWGLGVGFMSGLLGIGGGVFIIPLLRYVLKVDMRTALASSLMVVVMVSFSGFFTSLIVYKQIEFPLLAKLSIAAMVGIFIGHRIGLLLPEKTLQRIFSISLVLISSIAVLTGI